MYVAQSSTFALCVCAVIPFIMDVRKVYALAGVTHEESQTGFLHLLFCGACLNFYRE